MKLKECLGCPYLSNSKKTYFCNYRVQNKQKGLMRNMTLENIKNLTKCYLG